MTTYNYTINNIVFLDKLHEYIQETFDTYDFYTTNEGFNVNIIFANPLNESDQDLLTTIIEDYDPPQTKTIIHSKETIPIIKSLVNSGEYEIIATFYYIHSDTYTLTFNIMSYIIPNSESDSYNVRVYDSMNNNILKTITLNNTNMQLNAIEELDNIPTSDTLLEIHVKCNNTSTKVMINHINKTMYEII